VYLLVAMAARDRDRLKPALSTPNAAFEFFSWWGCSC
jgi:hypothetical protein